MKRRSYRKNRRTRRRRSAGENFAMLPYVTREVSNPISGSTGVLLAAGAVAAGALIYFAVKSKTAAASTAPALTIPGPYNPVALPATFVSGETYLVSIPTTALASGGVTSLSQAVSSLNALSSTAGFTVVQSYDVNQRPSNWPASDTAVSNWRFVISYTAVPGSSTGTFPVTTGAYVFTTNGNAT